MRRRSPLLLAGLLATAGKGTARALRTDAAGNIFLLYDQNDGVRIYKLNAAGDTVLASATLGSAGDAGIALVVDGSGNVYVTGTSGGNGTISGFGAVTYPLRADASINSFATKLSNALTVQWTTFLGTGRTASAAIATNGSTVVITGTTYSNAFPVTPNAIQQSPASGSSGNGFVTALNASSGTVAYATYLTGANGTVTPAAIAEDSAGNGYVAGSLNATGFPTVNAIIPRILTATPGGSSGFLAKLSPAGDQFVFSTFIPGDGIQSIALDDAATGLLLSGDINPADFPVANSPAPLTSAKYQSVIRVPFDGQSVTLGSIVIPGTQSAVAAGAGGTAWLSANLSAKLLPLNALQDVGNAATLHITATGDVDVVSRFGGVAVGNTGTAFIQGTAASIALSGGAPVSAFTIAPTLSDTRLATQRFDLPLVHAPSSALPSTVRDAIPASCNGQCQGSAVLLARVDPANSAPQLALSIDGSPNIMLRNLGRTAAQGVTISITGFASYATSCTSTLAPAAVCDIELTGNGPGSISVSAANADATSSSIPATTATANTIVVLPKELDFGIVSAAGVAVQRSVTVTNLASTSQTFLSVSAAVGKHGWSVAESATDSTPITAANTKLLAAGASCHITLAFTASADRADDTAIETPWTIGGSELLLTAYTQAAALNVSSNVIDFGRRYTNGIRTSRYLFLSNNSTSQLSHAHLTLPSGSPFSVIDGCASTLAPRSVCRIQFDYNSSTAPSADATTLTLDDGSSLLVQGETVPQPTVNGTVANPNLSVSPTSISFSTATAATTVSAETHNVTIRNTGASALAFTLAITGDFNYTTDCPATLAGGASCNAQIGFTPSAGGTRQGLFSVTAGAFAPAYVDLTGIGTPILPGNLALASFGDVPIGVPSVQWVKVARSYIALTATVTGSNDFTVVLAEDAGFGHGSPASSTFAATKSGSCLNCWIGIQFIPSSIGTKTAAITLQTSPGGAPFVLQATGTGLPLNGVLLTPTSFDYGPVIVGSYSAPQVFTLTNATSSATTVSAPAASGDFTITTNATGAAPCGTSVAGGVSCLIPVRFNPTAVGLRTGALAVNTSASGNLTSILTGYGAPSDGVAFRPGSLRFDNVPGVEATQQTITVVNAGASDISVGVPTHTSPNFIISSSCGTLVANASCDVRVNFTPGSARVQDTLNVPVTLTTGGAPTANIYAIPLSGGYTTEDSGLQIVPEQMNFGSAATSTAGSARVFRVNNLTAHPLTIQASTPRQFALTQSACAGLAPNANCSLTVQFTPVTQGDITGTLLLTGTPTDGAATVNALGFLEGYGTGANTLQVSSSLDINGILQFGQVASGQSSTRTITLTNRGISAVTVRRVTSSAPFLSTTTCGAPLAANQSCAITLTYTPLFQTTDSAATPATDTDSIVIEADAANAPLIIDLVGHAIPQITATPSNSTPLVAIVTGQGTLSFASTATGESSGAQSVSITNTGNTPVHISSVFTNLNFAATSDCATLLPGAACTAQVRFTPQSSGPHIETLEINSDASVSLEFVTLYGTATPASISLSASSLEFGGVLVGASSIAHTITVTNNGATPVVFGNANITGEFALAGGTCPAPGGALSPNATCTAAATFAPIATGARRGTLSIATSATTLPLQVGLSGRGVQPQLIATPNSLPFGNVPVGQSVSLSFTLANSGTSDINNLGIASSNPAFTTASTCGITTIRAGSSCSITVTFAPAIVGSQTGALSIVSSDAASPLTVNMTGTGIQGGNFTLTINGANSASATVAQGLPATFSLALTPTLGFAGPVAITCAPKQQADYIFCSANPATVTLANGTQISTLTITTVSAQAATRLPATPWRGKPLLTLASLLPLALIFTKRRKLRVALATFITCFALATIGCGSKSNADPRIRYAPTGTYTFIVTASSTTGVPVSQTVTGTVAVQAK